jgi:hypothetical protein
MRKLCATCSGRFRLAKIASKVDPSLAAILSCATINRTFIRSIDTTKVDSVDTWRCSMTITLYHAPNSRSFGSLLLLEELGVPYNLHVLNLRTGQQRQTDYLQINPMGKVPALRDGDSLVTEQVAISFISPIAFPNADWHRRSGMGNADPICVGWSIMPPALSRL